jgi:hypothetical protein
MRFLSIVTLFLAALLALPAQAVVRGSASREPDGIRRSVVWLENSVGELCSGALIAPDLVLTAAHCLIDEAAYRVVAVNRAFRRVVADVVGAAVHPEFVPGTTPRTQPGVDLAIVKLAHPLGSDFRPIDLSSSGGIGNGQRVTVAGFGVTGERQLSSARVLRSTDLVSLGTVQITNRVTIVADPDRLAEIAGAGACRGDSGGPVLAPVPGGFRLAGIVSWSSGALRGPRSSACGGLTAVTPVADHMDWILQGVKTLQGLEGSWTSR